MSRKDAIINMRQVLIGRRDALRKALANRLNLTMELHEQASGDTADEAIASAQDDVNSKLAEAESSELTSIELAIERMREGCFGICEGCGSSIPMERLNVLPYAVCCVKCQHEMECQGGFLQGGVVDWSRLPNSSDDGDESPELIETDHQ